MTLQKVRKKALNNAIVKTVIKVVIGVAILVVSGVFNVLFGGTPLENLNPSEMVGKYVSYDVWTNYGWYAEGYTESNSGSVTIDYHEYLVPVGEVESDYYLYLKDRMWIGVKINSKSKMEKFDAATETYFNTVDMPEVMRVSGVVREMTYQEKGYYLDYIAQLYEISESEIASYANVLYYVVDTNEVNAYFNKGAAYMFGIAGLAFLGHAVYGMYVALSMKKHKTLVNYLVAYPEKDEKVEAFLESEMFNGIRMNNEYFAYHNAKSTIFEETKNIVWVYHHVTQHRTNGIKTGKTHAIMVGNLKGQIQSIFMPSEKAVQETMEYMLSKNDKIVLGYTSDLASLYQTNPERFLTLKEEYEKAQAENNNDQVEKENEENN